MAQKNTSTNSVFNDFDAVDGAVREITAKHEAENKIRRSHAIQRVLKWSGIFVIALAIALWIIFMAYRAMNAPYLEKEKIVEESKAKQELKHVTPGIIVENYVKFTRIPIDIPGYGEVVIGREYLNEFSVNPSSQWCYTERTSSSNISKKISLRTKFNNDDSYLDTDFNSLKPLGLTPAMLSKMQSLCRFD
jgi:hypothetical protein